MRLVRASIVVVGILTGLLLLAVFIPTTNPRSLYIATNAPNRYDNRKEVDGSYFYSPQPWLVMNDTLFLRTQTVRYSLLAPLVNPGVKTREEVDQIIAKRPSLKKYCSSGNDVKWLNK